MEEFASGFDYLAQLREINGKQVQTYTDLTKHIDSKAREKGIPINGQFELTPLCNLSCKMCYAHLTTKQLSGHSVLSVSTWKDLIHQAWEAGMINATLTGGECLSYPGFDEIYLYLHSLGCTVYILTNGLLLDDKRIQFFREHMPERIQITLYGCNDNVYEQVTGQRVFNKVIRNIQEAVAAGLPVTVNVTPSRFLGEDVFETIRIAKSFGTDFKVSPAIIQPREETGRSGQLDDPDIDMYIKIYQLINELDGKESKGIQEDKLPPPGGPFKECTECGLRCGGGRSSFAIDWKGNLTPCPSMGMIQSHPLEEGFTNAWAKVNQAANHWPRVPECIECPYDKVCANCAANMYRFAKPGEVPMALCERTRKIVSSGAYTIPDCE